MRTANNNDYSSIRTLAQLRAEREKLRWQIELQEERLERDWYTVRNALSLAGIIKAAMCKVESIQSLATGIAEGYRAISAIFNRREKES